MKKTLFTVLLMALTSGTSAQETTSTVSNDLKGTLQNTRCNPQTVATLKTGPNGIGFYTVSYSITIGANQAYLPATTDVPLDASSFDRVADGIKNIKDTATVSRKGTYDLQGRKVNHPRQNGVYIINGKKIQITKF